MADILDMQSGVLPFLRGPRGWQAVLAGGLAVMTAASATVVLRASDPASADTRVAVARLAQVYLPDGTNHPAVEGEVLPRGAELHTGDQGGAQLTTAGRRVYLDGLSTLRVQDGVRETLSRGNAMVDARKGAHLDLSTPAGLVAAPAGSVVRVEESLLTRVAVFRGSATLHPVGRSSATAVHALHQVKVQPQSLPQRETALQLQDDRWERAVAADLVDADQTLINTASGLADQEGQTFLSAVPAAFRTGPVPAAGPARGEVALTAAVAQAARTPGAYAKVQAYRAELGSWGVVAALVRADLSTVSKVLSAGLAPSTGPGGETVVNAGQAPSVAPTLVPSPDTSRGSTDGPTTKPTTTTTPTPVVTASPGLVHAIVGEVLTLVTPRPTIVRSDPSPTPSSGPCVLGVLLC